jgi:2',3'-cyclic-nucleotide 2'-phosphodiesterase (5'-nucleotidase family)
LANEFRFVKYESHKITFYCIVNVLHQIELKLFYFFSVRTEARRLKGEGVEILIALGHSGYELDMKMAKEIEEIDVVVGGHSHTFLWTGKCEY